MRRANWRLDDASAISLGFPHDFVRSAKGFAYGGVFEHIAHDRDERLGVSEAIIGSLAEAAE